MSVMERARYPDRECGWREGEERSQFFFCVSVEEPEELFETNWELEVDNFDDMGLKEEVLRGIYAFGFKEPSPIQQKGILPVI